MSEDDTKVIGYFSILASQDVLCDGDACVIAGSESAMAQYIEVVLDPTIKFRVKKTRFGDIMNGISRGGFYAFDSESYARFFPLAKHNGLSLDEHDFSTAAEGRNFAVVGYAPA